MAQLATAPHPGFKQGRDETMAEFIKRTKVELDRLIAISNGLKPGQIVGGVVRFQVADGYAEYLVVKASPLVLQHIPFADAYTVPDPLIRGLRRADIEEMLDRERKLHQMFSKPANPSRPPESSVAPQPAMPVPAPGPLAW